MTDEVLFAPLTTDVHNQILLWELLVTTIEARSCSEMQQDLRLVSTTGWQATKTVQWTMNHQSLWFHVYNSSFVKKTFFPIIFEPFFDSSHHLYLSHVFLSGSYSHWLSPPPCPLPSLFVCRSVDQFSVWLAGCSPLWLPRPSHLSLTPTSSPPHLLTLWAYGRLSGLNSLWL